uniref:Uncharacterized protein n=1 Tax=Onchocerca volvulus TaxID=6282 RepID=A0A8R1TJV6_ONCVO
MAVLNSCALRHWFRKCRGVRKIRAGLLQVWREVWEFRYLHVLDGFLFVLFVECSSAVPIASILEDSD